MPLVVLALTFRAFRHLVELAAGFTTSALLNRDEICGAAKFAICHRTAGPNNQHF